MIVVSDTSPLLNLAVVGKSYLLRDLYGEVIIPPAVAHELTRNGVPLDPAWTRVVAAPHDEELSALKRLLDPGEAEAILVAMTLQADLVLMDEKAGRRIAMQRGLKVTGLLGVLSEAKALGLIERCEPILSDLIQLAGFWIGDDLKTRYLHALNELDQQPG